MAEPREWPEGTAFLRTELELGLLFARIALDSNHKAKTLRNTANARLAYDTALKLRDKLLLASTESSNIGTSLELLKGQLLELGESF